MISHPNIVTAYDAEQAGDQHFLVMEYADGVDLANLVKDRGSLSVSKTCDFPRQSTWFALLALLMLATAIFGIPAEAAGEHSGK